MVGEEEETLLEEVDEMLEAMWPRASRPKGSRIVGRSPKGSQLLLKFWSLAWLGLTAFANVVGNLSLT